VNKHFFYILKKIISCINNQNLGRGSNSSQGSNSSLSATTDQRLRRKEQNRAAQRAFRERKEKYVKELEDKIKAIEAAHELKVKKLEAENKHLKDAMENMQKEMNQLKKTFSDNSTSPPYSNTQSPVVSVATTSTSPAVITPRVPSSAVACIRDKDGVSFCERLKQEVCSNAYDQLLTEPLFDSHGLLNDSVAEHPVPIVTTDMSSDKKERSLTELYNEFEQSLSADLSPQASKEPHSIDLISCSEVFSRMSQHPLFNKFDYDDLCDELKKRAKCSRKGPVFEEYEVKEVLDIMVERVRQDEQLQDLVQEEESTV
jgi:hypothetical protein